MRFQTRSGRDERSSRASGSARGEHNIGQLCRQEFGDHAYLVGFGTQSGTVAVASNWDGPTEIKDVRPSLAESYEAVFHATGIPRFMLNLRNGPLAMRDRR